MKPKSEFLYRGKGIGRKFIVTEAGEKFIRDNWEKMDNRQLAAAFGVSIDRMRIILHAKKILRIEMEYWTPEQTQFLLDHYKCIGDKELAEIFNLNWPKKKGWTFKHIEKKRMYLKLKRNKQELYAIQRRNVDHGRFLLCPVKRWLVSGVAAEGEIRMWRNSNGKFTPAIKIGPKFQHWGPWAWEKEYGPIPKGMVVVFKDGYDKHTIENLELISRAELSRRNGKKANGDLSDNYVAALMSINKPALRKVLVEDKDLLGVKRALIQLNRELKKKQHESA